MYGHEALITMRKGGQSPKIVFINDYHDATARDWQNPGEKYGETWPSDHATISTAGDFMETIDLRFVVGLTVSISGTDESRVKALYESCKDNGAAVVAAGVTDPSKPIHKQSGWTEVWRSTNG